MDIQHLRAAVDLGSNSFHLLIGERHGGEFIVRERLKQKVQLLAGFEDGRMHPDALQRGLDCLAGFAQRLAGVPSEHITVMGTCALRQAENRETFTDAAERLLQVPVRVISGEEEARLIDLGVADYLEPPAEGEPARSRLVVDIGGGSTEFALSTNHHGGRTLDECHSLSLGCVRFTDRFFSPAEVVPQTYRDARQAAVAVLREHGLKAIKADEIIGTSGSVDSIQGVLEVNGWCDDGIDLAGLREIEAAIQDRRWVSEVGLPGLAPERVDIFPAGMAILSAIFETLEIERMHFVDTTLLQGMLHESASVTHSVQARTVQALCRRFRVDADQAARVRRQVRTLVHQLPKELALPEPTIRLLDWAAELHEIGLAVAPGSYHRHGAYVLGHAPLHGFSQSERRDLALLVRGHRRSFPALAYRAVPAERRAEMLRAMLLLRLAVILERGHDDTRSPSAVNVSVTESSVTLSLPQDWLKTNVLSARELAVEAQQLEGVQLELKVEAS